MNSDNSSKLTVPAVPSSSEFAHSGLRGVDLPDDLRRHPLVAGRHFYTLPPQLWTAFRKATSDKSLDSETSELDKALSKIAEAIPGCVGFNDGNAITDCVLRETPPLDVQTPAVQAYLEECQKAGFRVNRVISLARRRLNGARESQRAYLGWLFTAPMFLKELREFWQQFRLASPNQREIPVGIAWEAQVGRSPLKPFGDSGSDPATRLTDAFCRHWRLTRIVAPLTVCPLGVQCPAPMAFLSAAHAQTSGSLLFIPDIAPLPDRDELRLMIEGVVRQTASEAPHLEEWFKLVLANNQGRKSLHSYARWHPLQHYLRVIHGRYGDQLGRAQLRVAQVVAEYLGQSPDQLRRDLDAVRRRLGRDWLAPVACREFTT